MANQKQELPFGWVVKQSKSYPDRIYYFNVNSGASTWEFPDLLQHYVSGQGDPGKLPVLTRTCLKTDNGTDKTVTSQGACNESQMKNKPKTATGISGKEISAMLNSPSEKRNVGQNTKFQQQPVATNRMDNKMDPFKSNNRRKLVPYTCSKEQSSASANQKRVSVVSQNVYQSAHNSDQKRPLGSKFVDTGQLPRSNTTKVVQNQEQTKSFQSEKVGKVMHRKGNSPTKPYRMSRNETLQSSVKGTSLLTSQSSKPPELMDTNDVLSLIKHQLHAGKPGVSDSKKMPVAMTTRNETAQSNVKGASLLPFQSVKQTKQTGSSDGVLNLIKQQLGSGTRRLSDSSRATVAVTSRNETLPSNTKGASLLPSQSVKQAKQTGSSDGVLNLIKQQLGSGTRRLSDSSRAPVAVTSRNETLPSNTKGTSLLPSESVKQITQVDTSSDILNLIKQQLQRGKRRASDGDKVNVQDTSAAINKSLNAVKKCVKSLGKSLNQEIKGVKVETSTGKPSTTKAVEIISGPTNEMKRSKFENRSTYRPENSSKAESNVVSKLGVMNQKKGSEKTTQKLDTATVTADTRKVIRSSQNATENRCVKLKDKKITNLQKSAKSEKLPVDVDLTVSTNAAQISEGSLRSIDDVCEVLSDKSDYNHNSTEFKLFIGDKEKLMSIQSWINNLQEDAGSGSPSLDSQANLVHTNDSGYVSPENTAAIPKRKGWPGELKKSDAASREVVVMEIDECLVPKSSPSEDMEEGMEIDEVLVEVRQQVNASGDKNMGSFVTSFSDTVGSSPASKLDQGITVVVDTNILISDIPLLEKLKDYQLPGGSVRPCLFIPWIVLRELDALKETAKPGKLNLSLATQRKARRGISFLKDMFGAKHPRVRGQTPKQAEEASKDFQSHCNDDAVLQACLQCKKSVLSVVLLSNDNNLVTKALVSDVPAYTAKEIMTGLWKAQETLLAHSECHTPARTPGIEHTSAPCHTPASAAVASPAGAPYLTPTGAGAPFATPTSALCHTPASAQVTNTPGAPFASPANAFTPSVQCATPARVQTPHSVQTLGNFGRQTPSIAQYQTPQNCHYQTPVSVNRTVNGMNKQGPMASQSVLNGGENSQRVDKQDVMPSCTQRKACMVDRILNEEKPYTSEALMEDVFCRMKTMIHEAFGKILEVEMKAAYDDIWIDIVLKKPPWSLRDVLECWKKHWIAVFGLVFSRHLSKNVHVLLDYVSGPRSVCKKIEAVCDMCANSSDLLTEAKQRNVYGTRIPEICDTVMILSELCYGIKLGSISVAAISSLDQYIHSKISSDVIKTDQSTSDQNSSSNALQTNTMQTGPHCVSQTGPQSNALGNYPSVNPSALQHCVNNNIPQTGSSAGNQNRGPEQTELLAGDRFSHIWKFIYGHCDEFYKMLSGTTAIDRIAIEPVLKELVSSSLELRKYYAGLLELQVDDLKNHEEEFTALCHISNSFLSKFNEQDNLPSVTPLQLLILYSKPQYRDTLKQFLSQLDEMLHVMYQCLHKLCPDD